MFDNTLDLCSLTGIGNDPSHLISEMLQLISEANQLIS
nr:MAG TPA: hypothetical protein [Crassvirales sp.]